MEGDIVTTNRVTRRYKRRSMRRRITKMMVLNSLISNIIMGALFLMVVFGAMGSFGMIFSDVVAGDIAQELENPQNKIAMSGADLEAIKQDKEIMQKWYHSIGNKYHFNFSDGFIMRTQEEIMTAVDVDAQTKEYTFVDDDGTLFQFGLVFVEITMGDDIAFSTMPADHDMSGQLLQAMKHYEYTSIQPYYNVDGVQVGEVSVTFNAMILVGITMALIALFVVSALISSMVSLVTSSIASGALTKSLADLQRKMRNLSEGDIESAIHSELEIKRPVSEIEDLAKSTNSIIEQMREHAHSLENHKAELEAQNVELVTQGNELTLINNKIENVNVQMKDILDNVGQGFLRFEDDLMIHSEYSMECREMFSVCVANKKFSTLLFPDDPSQATFVDDLLQKILQQDNDKIELYMPLLPDEMEFRGQIIQIEYKVSKSPSSAKSMIVILTNITETRQLEEQMDQERYILKMVVKVMVNRSLFIEVSESFEQFMFEGQDCGWIFNDDPEENVKYIMRQLHTFKGNFSQYDVIALTGALHETESRLLKALDGQACENDSIENCVKANMLNEAYQKDMGIIKTYVGDEFMVEDDHFLIEKTRIVEIERKMQSVLSEQECKMLLPEIRSLRYRPIKELLKMYPEYTLKLAERLDKAVASFEIQADDIMIDEARYQNLAKSLVHVFRNAIDHGIELPDDRVESGKDLMGRISCIVSDLGEAFEIIVSDDGAGLRPEQIRSRLLDMGHSQESLQELTDNELLHHVFEDSLSTKVDTSELSGRGVGLAAVRKEVELLDGHISVTSSEGVGTTFTFRIPYAQSVESGAIVPLNFMKELAQTSVEYINNHVVKYDITDVDLVGKTNQIELYELTALVSLKGVINALIMISVNRLFGEKLVNSFLYEPVAAEELDKYVEDVLAEIANTLLGNTLGQFDDVQDFLHMGIPAIISNQGAYVKYTDAEILTFNLNCGDNHLSINMIQLESDQIEEATLWQEY